MIMIFQIASPVEKDIYEYLQSTCPMTSGLMVRQTFYSLFLKLVLIILICVRIIQQVPLRDHMILKTLNACSNALLDDLLRCAKNSKTKLI